MHSHSIHAVMATMLDPHATEFHVTELEMIKGIVGHSFYGGCKVPIIENTARECELTDRLSAAIEMYPDANAVLVRRHGVYVWGDDWIKAKTQAECYDYLFQAAFQMKQLGIDAQLPCAVRHDPDAIIAAAAAKKKGVAVTHGTNGAAAPGSKLGTKRKAGEGSGEGPLSVRAVVLDVEGTIASQSFVTDVLFAYVRKALRGFLDANMGQAASANPKLKAWVAAWAAQHGAGTMTVTHIEKSVLQAMDKGKKDGLLKQFEGMVMESGFHGGKLHGDFFPDLLPALRRWKDAQVPVYIYSSGSRLVQRLVFQYAHGVDLRPYLAGYFDTSSGDKVTASSYENIALSLGMDGEDILFLTDNPREVDAAHEAGWQVRLAVREGNVAQPTGWRCPAPVGRIHSLDEVTVTTGNRI